MSLADWAESVFRTVEQDGAFATRVQLITPATGDIWHTWNHPLPAPQDWVVRAEQVLRSLEQQCAGRTAVTFVALGVSGETLAQLPWKVVGKMAGGNLESTQQAAAAVFASLSQTLERSNELVQVQLRSAREHMETQSSFISQQQTLIMAYRGRDLSGEENASPLANLIEQFGPQIGSAFSTLVAVAGHYLQKAQASNLAKAPAEASNDNGEQPAARTKRKPSRATIKR